MPCIEVAQLANTQVAPSESGARAQDYTSARRQISTCVLGAVVNLSVCCGVRATGDCQRKREKKKKRTRTKEQQPGSTGANYTGTSMRIPRFCTYLNDVGANAARSLQRPPSDYSTSKHDRVQTFSSSISSRRTPALFSGTLQVLRSGILFFFLVLFLGSLLLGRIREDYQFRMDTRARSLHAPCKQPGRLHTGCPALRFRKAPVTYTEDASHDPLTQCSASDNPIRGVNQRFRGIAGGVDATNGISSGCKEALRTT